MAEVVEVEGPVHVAEVARRIAEAAGGRRLGPRVLEAIDRAAEEAMRPGWSRVGANSSGLPRWIEPEVRDRARPAGRARGSSSWSRPEEIALAVERVVADAFGMEPAAVPAAACRLLGFPRMGDDMRARVEMVVADLVALGRLDEKGGFLVHRDLRVAG